MIHKRAFSDDNLYEFACKHPRQMEHIDQLAPIFPLDSGHQKHLVSGKGAAAGVCYLRVFALLCTSKLVTMWIVELYFYSFLRFI
jgi:hypothetical protein